MDVALNLLRLDEFLETIQPSVTKSMPLPISQTQVYTVKSLPYAMHGRVLPYLAERYQAMWCPLDCLTDCAENCDGYCWKLK
jgi:hypothetical protein